MTPQPAFLCDDDSVLTAQPHLEGSSLEVTGTPSQGGEGLSCQWDFLQLGSISLT